MRRVLGGKVVKSCVAGGLGGFSLNRLFRPLRGHPELSGAAVRARASGARPLARVRRDDSNPSLSESAWAGGPCEGRCAPPRRLRSFFPRGAVGSVRTKDKETHGDRKYKRGLGRPFLYSQARGGRAPGRHGRSSPPQPPPPPPMCGLTRWRSAAAGGFPCSSCAS